MHFKASLASISFLCSVQPKAQSGVPVANRHELQFFFCNYCFSQLKTNRILIINSDISPSTGVCAGYVGKFVISQSSCI